MVRLFGRPSRSYASSASPYLDPTSSYPILGPMEDEDVGPSQSRARWDGDSGSVGSVAEPSPQPTSKPRKKVHLVVDPEPPRAGPSSLFNGSHTSSHAKPHGAAKRNRQLSEAMKSFSAMDLAPPPPKPRTGITNGHHVPNVTHQTSPSANPSDPEGLSIGSSLVSSVGPSKSYSKHKPTPLNIAAVPLGGDEAASSAATRPLHSPGETEDWSRDSNDSVDRSANGGGPGITTMSDSTPIKQSPVVAQGEGSPSTSISTSHSTPQTVSIMPSLSIQPPTPMHDVESTPFHADSPADSPVIEVTRGSPTHDSVAPTAGLQSVAEEEDSGAVGNGVAPISNPSSQPGSSGNSRQSSSDSLGLRRPANPHHLRPRPSTASDRHRPSSSARSSSPVFRGPVQPPISVPFLPPADPSQPSYLRWDPGAQRWVPAHDIRHAGHEGLSRPGSIISSSASSYSQASAQPFAIATAASITSARRASLPHLTVSTRSPTPSDSAPSRPISPSSHPNRRMSIEPAYSISPSILTLLPEMTNESLATMPSRPPSLSQSVSKDRLTRPASITLPHRNSAVFPVGYDVDTRAWIMSKADQPRNDVDQREEVTSNRGSRPPSVYSNHWESQHPAPRPSSSLDVMSTRGDPVPLLGADGTGGEGLGGYTSLVLPTGSYKPSAPNRNLQTIDPRVLGMPTTTMSTITINSAGPSRRNSFVGRRHSETPAHLLTDQPAPVSFSSHQPPPSKISPSQVLVQVYTVALDRTDLDKVREKAAAGSGAGKWVPGRSFCGRALDVGADVRTIVKGDLVMGVVDVKKSGTLAEYITCDRRRIARTPPSTDLSLEQLACLPLLGVLAHRASSHCTSRGSRALILHAHEGVGALVCQELSARGVNVIAQAPATILGAEEDCWENGAREVFLDDDEVGMINEQHESGFEFVLDTVGGRRVYDAARRVMRTGGVFVTLYGDTGHTPTPSSPIKSSLHSLRRAFVRKDKKTISYVHLSPGSSGTVVGGSDVDPSGLDSRDILELGVMRGYRPKVGVVLPFERAGDGLEMVGRSAEGDEWEGTGTVVIRLIN